MGQMFKDLEGTGNTALGELLKNAGNAIKTIFDAIKVETRRLEQCHLRIQEDMCEIVANSPAFPDGWGDGFNTDAQQAAYLEALNNLDNLEQTAMTETFTGDGQEAVIFKEQCFLLSFIGEIAGWKKYVADPPTKNSTHPDGETGTAMKRLPYVASELNPTPLEENASVLLDGESYSFLNLLTQHPSLHVLHDIYNHELSNLQPRLRLWKVIFDEETGEEREIEIAFNSYMAPDELDLFMNNPVRGAGAGLKSFNFT